MVASSARCPGPACPRGDGGMALPTPTGKDQKQPGQRVSLPGSIPAASTEHLLGLGPEQLEGFLPSKTNTGFGKSPDTLLNVLGSAVPLESPFPKPQGSASAPFQCRRPFRNGGLRLFPSASGTPPWAEEQVPCLQYKKLL